MNAFENDETSKNKLGTWKILNEKRGRKKLQSRKKRHAARKEAVGSTNRAMLLKKY